MRHHPPTLQEPRQLPPTAPSEEIPPSTPVAPPRGNKGTRAHRNLCSPLKRPRRQQRQLSARANPKAHTQLSYNGSRTCSANRRSSWSDRGRTVTCWEGFETWTTEEPEGSTTTLQHHKSRDNSHLRRHKKRHHPQHLWHHLHGLERGNKGTRAHRNLCSPLKRPRRQQRQLIPAFGCSRWRRLCSWRCCRSLRTSCT